MNGEVQAIDWGAEIPVDGKRPEWLDGYDGPVRWFNCDQPCGVTLLKSGRLNWGNYYGMEKGGVHAIRLPADHPHYAWQASGHSLGNNNLGTNDVPTPPQGIAPEVVTLTGEQANMLRKLLAWVKAVPGPFADEAAACLAMMEPVDGDLLEARRIAADHVPFAAEKLLSGQEDGTASIKAVLAAIKRGRSLAAGDGR